MKTFMEFYKAGVDENRPELFYFESVDNAVALGADPILFVEKCYQRMVETEADPVKLAKLIKLQEGFWGDVGTGARRGAMGGAWGGGAVGGMSGALAGGLSGGVAGGIYGAGKHLYNKYKNGAGTNQGDAPQNDPNAVYHQEPQQQQQPQQPQQPGLLGGVLNNAMGNSGTGKTGGMNMDALATSQITPQKMQAAQQHLSSLAKELQGMGLGSKLQNVIKSVQDELASHIAAGRGGPAGAPANAFSGMSGGMGAAARRTS